MPSWRPEVGLEDSGGVGPATRAAQGFLISGLIPGLIPGLTLQEPPGDRIKQGLLRRILSERRGRGQGQGVGAATSGQ